MGEVIPFDRGRNSSVDPSGTNPRAHEVKLFVLGVLATVVAPQMTYSISGGPIPPWVFVVCAQAAVIVGLILYIRPPAKLASVVKTQTVPISRDDKFNRRKVS